MIVDVSTFVGPYPFRHLSHATPAWLVTQMDRLGIGEAWVGFLPAFLHRDPAESNSALERAVSADPRLRPVHTVHPALPNWESELKSLRGRARAVRAYPNHWGIDPAGSEMQALTRAAANIGSPILLTVRFEDLRQRHRIDATPNLPAAAVRSLARTGEDVRIVVTHADRHFIEEVHFGLTDGESERVLWDISWIWGPPEEHLKLLLATMGPDRFVFGTGMPLRVPDAAVAKLDLLDLSSEVRQAIERSNVQKWATDDP